MAYPFHLKGIHSIDVRIGCAGWSVPKVHAGLFQAGGTHLERYASLFRAVEINTSFYRPHRPATYARWAASVPQDFRFAVKVPKAVTHERRLMDSGEILDRFVGEVGNLGDKLGPLLVQLPPSLGFAPDIAARFFAALRGRFTGNVACEPRHESWFKPAATQLLTRYHVARVAADPAVVAAAAEPGGWNGLKYYRLHGSPRVYYSSYTAEHLRSLAERFLAHAGAAMVWCIFDNTALGAAAENANKFLQEFQTE